MSRALVLSGGAIKGAYQAGAMQAVFRAGWFPDVIVGISTGALSAAFVVDHIGRETDALPTAEQWASAADALAQFYIERVTGPGAVAKERARLSLLWHVATHSGFDGFSDSAPLWSLITNTIQERNLQRVASAVRLEVGAVNVVSGALDYQNANNNPGIVRHIYASTAMPLVMPLVYEGSIPYCDGGICAITPIGHAINLGADEVICIVCQTPELREGIFDPRNMVELTGRLVDIVSYGILKNDLKQVSLINKTIRKCGGAALTLGPKTYSPIRWKRIEPDGPLNYELTKFSTNDIRYMIDFGARTGRAIMQDPWQTD